MTATERITTPFSAQSTAAEVVAGIDLTGRRAIVTGGASGIGIETARALAVAGAEVTLAVRKSRGGRAHRCGHHRDHRQQADPGCSARPGQRVASGPGFGGSRACRLGQFECTPALARGVEDIHFREREYEPWLAIAVSPYCSNYCLDEWLR